MSSQEFLLPVAVVAATGALLRQYTDGLDHDEFASNVEKQDSVIRRLEIIGEAVKGIPDDLGLTTPACRAVA